MAMMADCRYHNHHTDVAPQFRPALKIRPLQYVGSLLLCRDGIAVPPGAVCPHDHNFFASRAD
eukprot:8575632-Alexandrium_andersonii.AAC.1